MQIAFNECKHSLEIKSAYLNTSEGHAENADMQKSAIQKIAFQCIIRIMGEENETSDGLFQKVLDGDIRDLQTPEFIQRNKASLPNLPLNPIEEAQCWKLLQTAPVCLKPLALMDVLSFQVYRSMNFLAKEGKIPYLCVEEFCRDWLIGCISQYTGIELKTSIIYSSSKFVTCMEKNLQEIVRSSTKKNKKKYPLHYEQAINGITILLKIWQVKDSIKFLQDSTCGENAQVAAHFPPELEDPDQMYGGILELIDFFICAYSQTHLIQTFTQDQTVSHLSDIKDEFINLKKNIYLFNNGKSRDVLSINSIIATQKNLLDKYRIIFQNIKKIQTQIAEWNQKSTTHPILRKKIDDKRAQGNVAMFHQICYMANIDNIIYLVDDYILKSIPEHVTTRARLYRIAMVNAFISSFILDAHDLPSQRAKVHAGRIKSGIASNLDDPFVPFLGAKLTEEFNRPEMHFLSEANKGAFIYCLTLCAQELVESFAPEQTLVDYAEEVASSNLLIDPKLTVLHDYKILFEQVTPWLAHLYANLDKMQKTHSQLLIKFLDELSPETCRMHKNTILEYVEDFLLEQVVPYYMTYMLHQDVHFVTQNASVKEPLTFLDTPLATYLLMEDFEHAFFEKIALGEQPEVLEEPQAISSEVLLDQEVHLQQQVTLSSIHVKKGSFPSLLSQQTPPVRTSRSRNCAEAPEMKRSLTPSFFRIRKGEKLRKILKKLKDLGLDIARQKGSHARLRNSCGEGVTVSKHGEGRPITATVRRGVERQVNDIFFQG